MASSKRTRALAEALAEPVEGDWTKPMIEVTDEIPTIVDALEAAILAFPERLLFQRGGRLVRLVRGAELPHGLRRPHDAPTIGQAPMGHLAEIASRVACWMKFDGRTQELKAMRPPRWAVESFAERAEWHLPTLSGIIEAPALRPDGTVLSEPGYDEATGLLLAVSPNEFPPVPTEPSREQAYAALADLSEIFEDFPFVDEVDRSAALAALLTLLGRPGIRGPVPMFLMRSPTAGTGKSLCADACSVVATGRPAPRIPQATSENEERKRLLAFGLEGDPTLLLDNVTRPLGNGALDAVLTAGEIKDRILGVSQTARTPWTAVMFATGNNLMVAADTGRRVIPIDLDAKVERPDERSRFTHSPLLEWLKKERPRLVVAGLTVLRAYLAAGAPKQHIPDFGSFERWSDLIRGALVWCGARDPAAGREKIRRDSDPTADALRVVLALWHERFGPHGQPVAMALKALDEGDPLREALAALVPDWKGRGLQSQTIAYAFRKYRGRIAGGLRLEVVEERQGTAVWGVKACT